jgi:FkbM family methyltransferase
MLIRVLTWLRRSTRGTFFRRALEPFGIIKISKRLYNALVIRRRYHQATIMGQPLRFFPSSGMEITRIDGVAEEHFIQRILDHLCPGDVIWDIGANIGLVSLVLAAGSRQQRVRIVAFEPEPATARSLRRNIAANHLSNIAVLEVALSKDNGSAELFIGGESGAGTHSLVPAGLEGSRRVRVLTQTGASIAQEQGRGPDVVKIDVEGAEMDVLRGCEPLLRSGSIRELFIEIHPDRLGASGADERGLVAWVEQHGYLANWSERRGGEIHRHFRHSTIARTPASP